MKEGWEIKELQDCLSYIKNGANIKQTKGASGIPITRIETLSGGQFHRDKLGYADVYELGKFAPYVLDDADILMSHINSKAYIGRSVIYHKQGDEQIIHGMNLLRLKFFPDMINPEFANYYFKCTFFLSEVAKIRKDAVNQSSMAISDLKRIAIPVPPLSEQQHIVEELDLLSSIIEKKKAQLNELDNLAQSLFYEMFGDPITNEYNYQVFKLGDICSTITKGTTPTSAGFSFTDEGVNFIKVESFDRDESFNPQKVAHISKECNEALKRSILEENDILMCIAGATCGRLAIVPKEALPANTNQAFGIIRLKEKERELLSYVYSYLHSQYIKNLVNELMKGVAQPNLTLAHLRNFNIIMPPASLLKLFSSKIDSINHQKELIKQSIKEVETLFNSRMDYYFN